MKNLIDYIKEAEEKRIAIGHFNVSNLETLHGVLKGVEKASQIIGFRLPVIIGVSEGEEKFFGIKEISSIIKSYKDEGLPVFLNADHHYSFESVKNAIDYDFDSVVVDGAGLPLEQNIELTKKCIEYARTNKNKKILIESEIGFIGKSSKILEKIPDGVSEETKTKVDDAIYFVQQTNTDLLAPSVGNIHGMVKGGNPKLDIERIKEIKEKTQKPLVLHGGSGISDDDFLKAIEAGISIIHINTEIRIAYKNALKKAMLENEEEIAPYKYLTDTVSAVADVVENRIVLFSKNYLTQL